MAVGTNDQGSDFIIEFNDAKAWTTAEEVIFAEAEHMFFLERVPGKKIETVSK